MVVNISANKSNPQIRTNLYTYTALQPSSSASIHRQLTALSDSNSGTEHSFYKQTAILHDNFSLWANI